MPKIETNLPATQRGVYVSIPSGTISDIKAPLFIVHISPLSLRALEELYQSVSFGNAEPTTLRVSEALRPQLTLLGCGALFNAARIVVDITLPANVCYLEGSRFGGYLLVRDAV